MYFLIFWTPAVASAVTLVLQWGSLRRPPLFLLWFLLALLLQFRGTVFSATWAIGLVLQAILAVILVIRMKLS